MLSTLCIDDNNTDQYDHKKKIRERKIAISSFQLERLNPPGLKEIKQVELWKHWGQFVPHPYKAVICPKPPQDVIDRIKQEKSAKQKAATKKRKSRVQ